MKYLIWILFIASVGSIFLGFAIPDSDTTDALKKANEIAISEKLIGFGIVGLFVLVFPLFSYYRWKDKKASDYMLNKENIEKMRAYNNKKE
ncbi:membrane protein [Formosa sp. Hel3_A1_48]|jgi:hypothetical protein|uniref:hypothetical protein n=1 Tax=Formosa sp. Hel3_A1_48 TaxID=1336795 RepID=UPI00084E20E1|nr:hypothetical protein [Formosa sp. Hel3_A1_48]MDA0326147.1 hypothetical protein [Bacteroidota bacterium]MDA8531720.1 hypothetical protein [Flavobacteriaceae bacterium]AOR26509.1 membrane protein [Formosa sp. Hel3_A1_48]MDC0634613.1 hypothetical protein [Flavobacteriaceae bacterium]NCF42733.1 hypothetical protein [Bacteroidota bacterium]